VGIVTVSDVESSPLGMLMAAIFLVTSGFQQILWVNGSYSFAIIMACLAVFLTLFDVMGPSYSSGKQCILAYIGVELSPDLKTIHYSVLGAP